MMVSTSFIIVLCIATLKIFSAESEATLDRQIQTSYTGPSMEKHISNVSEHTTTSHINSNTKRVAIIYAGHVRSFATESVRNSHKENLIQPLKDAGFLVYAFFVKGHDDDPRDKKLARFNETGNTVEVVTKWFQQMGVEEVRVNDPECPEAPILYKNCEDWTDTKSHHLNDIPRWWGTWWRVREAYRIATSFEEEVGWNFDVMFRIRPDFYFLKKIDVSEIEASNEGSYESKHQVFTPLSQIVKGQTFNDWGVACHRHACSGYFDLISAWGECRAGMCCWAWTMFYDRYFDNIELRVRHSESLFPVTLVKKKYVECNRVGELKGAGLLKICYDYALSQGLKPQYTCYRGDTVQVDRKCEALWQRQHAS